MERDDVAGFAGHFNDDGQFVDLRFHSYSCDAVVLEAVVLCTSRHANRFVLVQHPRERAIFNVRGRNVPQVLRRVRDRRKRHFVEVFTRVVRYAMLDAVVVRDEAQLLVVDAVRRERRRQTLVRQHRVR